jgi:hypothetical protein
MRMNMVLSLSVTVTTFPAAVVTITWRVSGLSSDTTPITLRAVMAGSDAGVGEGVCAFDAAAPASNASVHSTRMLPNFLMFFPGFYSQTDSALISGLRRSMR